MSLRRNIKMPMQRGIRDEGMKRLAKTVNLETSKQAQDMEDGYQGWKNYETWAISLWMDNDQGSYEYWRKIIQEMREEESEHDEFTPESVTDEDLLRHNLADRLKADHEEMMPALEGVWGDLLNGALSEVDWGEIAANLLTE